MLLTMFSFGYWGWGTATEQLVKAVDAVESARGFKPPVFVDTRLQRSVRAPGFNGNAFEKQVGSKRYRWMPELGNEFIRKRRGPPIQIAQPEEAKTLLHLASELAEDSRRVIFFCSCPFPINDWGRCHRTEIASLLLKAARRQGQALQVVEWPGGAPERIRLSVDASTFKRLHSNSWFFSAPEGLNLARAAGLPWGSIIEARSHDRLLRIVAGPALFRSGEWQFPVDYKDLNDQPRSLLRESAALRRMHGFEPRKT